MKGIVGLLAAAAVMILATSKSSTDKNSESEVSESPLKALPLPPDELKNVSSEKKVISLTCSSCGGTYRVIDDGVYKCPYCNHQEILIDSDVVKLVKDRHKTYSDVELNKQNSYSKIEIEREKTKQLQVKNENKSQLLSFVIVIISMLGVFVIAFGPHFSKQPDHSNEIKVPNSAKNYKGENVNATVKGLEALGFVNIETEPLNDLSLGWIKKENTVDSIYINGNSTFSSDTWFPYNAEVQIYYHSFKSKD